MPIPKCLKLFAFFLRTQSETCISSTPPLVLGNNPFPMPPFLQGSVPSLPHSLFSMLYLQTPSSRHGVRQEQEQCASETQHVSAVVRVASVHYAFLWLHFCNFARGVSWKRFVKLKNNVLSKTLTFIYASSYTFIEWCWCLKLFFGSNPSFFSLYHRIL